MTNYGENRGEGGMPSWLHDRRGARPTSYGGPCLCLCAMLAAALLLLSGGAPGAGEAGAHHAGKDAGGGGSDTAAVAAYGTRARAGRPGP